MALEDLQSQFYKDEKEQRNINVLNKEIDLFKKKSLYRPAFSTVTGISGAPNFLFLSQVSDTTVFAAAAAADSSTPSIIQGAYFEINDQGESYYESGYFE
jgi:hypothetical protein